MCLPHFIGWWMLVRCAFQKRNMARWQEQSRWCAGLLLEQATTGGRLTRWGSMIKQTDFNIGCYILGLYMCVQCCAPQLCLLVQSNPSSIYLPKTSVTPCELHQLCQLWWDLFLHLHTYCMQRHEISSCTCTYTKCNEIVYCTCTHTWCYAMKSCVALHTSLVLRQGAFLWHLRTFLMLGCEIFSCTYLHACWTLHCETSSCTCTHTWCHQIFSCTCTALRSSHAPTWLYCVRSSLARALVLTWRYVIRPPLAQARTLDV